MLLAKRAALSCISVASSGALGNVPPSTSNCLNFSGHFTAAQTLTFDSYLVKTILAHSFVAVFHDICVCVTLTLFSLGFGPLLAPSSDDVTAQPIV